MVLKVKSRLHSYGRISVVCSFFAAYLLTISAFALAQNGSDELILDAYAYWKENDTDSLRHLVGEVEASHPLASYVEGWYLRSSLKAQSAAAIRDFLRRNEDSVIANQLRNDWVVSLARQGDRHTFFSEWSKLKSPNADARCLSWLMRWRKGERDALVEAFKALWLEDLRVSKACQPIIDAIGQSRLVNSRKIEQRARLQVQTKRLSNAQRTLGYLRGALAIKSSDARLALRKSRRWLKRMQEQGSLTNAERMLTSLAIGAMARKKSDTAGGYMRRLGGHLNSEQRSWTWGLIGWGAALGHHPSATGWYNKATSTASFSNSMHEWRVRASLRERDWRAVQRNIQELPKGLAEKSEWVYWLARAHRAQGNLAEAKRLLETLSDKIEYYGVLAREELGRNITIPPRAPARSKEEIQWTGRIPALRRSIAFSRLGLYRETVDEWNHGLRGLNERQMLAAADFAASQGAYNRAISTLIRLKEPRDFVMRFPKPWLESIRPIVTDEGMDEDWVYGLIRQESRFMREVRSWAGAQGLMQLMPRTASWVAKKTGMDDYNESMINDLQTNVRLGTAYLSMVYDQLHGSQVLATAAYNAGPGRARRWCSGRPQGADIYIETIPFNETRNYVKAVMVNATYYGTLQRGQPDSLKRRLGVGLRAPCG